MPMFDQPNLILTLLAFGAVIGPLIFVHELGHYLAGRWCGVHAEAFSIGFGPQIFGWRDQRGTMWRIALLPLGGYVQFLGDRDPASQQNGAWRDLPHAERSRSFPAQPVWRRAVIVAAGPLVNFLFAVLILAGFAFANGVATTPPVVGLVMPDSAAAAAGLRPGDRIVSVDGRAMATFEDIPMTIAHRTGGPAVIEIERAGQQITQTLTPRLVSETDRFGNQYRRALIGIQQGQPVVSEVGPVAALGVGIQRTGAIIRQTGEVLGQLLTGQRSIKDMGGPVRIAKTSGEVATMGVEALIVFAALISINLGFINLLPLPMLDGGHLLFHAYEAIRGKPAPPQAQEWAFRFGLAAVVTLMLVVTFNDLGALGLWDGAMALLRPA